MKPPEHLDGGGIKTQLAVVFQSDMKPDLVGNDRCYMERTITKTRNGGFQVIAFMRAVNSNRIMVIGTCRY